MTATDVHTCTIAPLVTGRPGHCTAHGITTVLTLTAVQVACAEHARAYRATSGIEQDNAAVWTLDTITGQTVTDYRGTRGTVESAYAADGRVEELVVRFEDGWIRTLDVNAVRVHV